jgi:uncharacterized membrane protein
MLQNKGGKPPSQHDLTVGMFVVFVIMLGIALVIFIAGPRSNNPPPTGVGYAVTGLALLFGFIAFLSFMKEQSEDADSSHTNSES